MGVGAMSPYSDMRDLPETLRELKSREERFERLRNRFPDGFAEPTYPLCCLLLWLGQDGLDRAVQSYVRSSWGPPRRVHRRGPADVCPRQSAVRHSALDP